MNEVVGGFRDRVVGFCVMSEEALAVKLAVLRPHLDERQWRLLLGAEAEAIGRGGISLVARLSEASRKTVQVGVGGGSNGNRLRAFKVEVAGFAAQTGLQVTVCHFPPGTSKWNKVEHRLFSFISMNWRGRPLTDYQVVVETIAATTTETGLTVATVLDPTTYPTGIRISDTQMKAVPVQRYAFHGEWNYLIHPGLIPETVRNQTINL